MPEKPPGAGKPRHIAESPRETVQFTARGYAAKHQRREAYKIPC